MSDCKCANALSFFNTVVQLADKIIDGLDFMAGRQEKGCVERGSRTPAGGWLGLTRDRRSREEKRRIHFQTVVDRGNPSHLDGEALRPDTAIEKWNLAFQRRATTLDRHHDRSGDAREAAG